MNDASRSGWASHTYIAFILTEDKIIPNQVPFSQVLELLENHGWTVQRIWKPYRVFVKSNELPILIPVEDGKVNVVYVEKIKKILGLPDQNE